MVQQIEINGIAVKVLFGMHFAENFSNESFTKAEDSGAISGLSSKFLTSIIWCGYLNWCEVKEAPPQVTKADVYEWIETAYSNDDEPQMQKMRGIIEAYKRSSFGKGIEQLASSEDAKKKLNGQKLEPLPLE